jgi:hypothetical protein
MPSETDRLVESLMAAEVATGVDRRVGVGELVRRLVGLPQRAVVVLPLSIRARIQALCVDELARSRDTGDVLAERRILSARLRIGALEAGERIRYAQLLTEESRPIDYADVTVLVELAGRASRGQPLPGWSAARTRIAEYCAANPRLARLVEAQLAVERGAARDDGAPEAAGEWTPSGQ